jgi:hypothetical protein
MAGCADWRRRCWADRSEAAACIPTPLWFSAWVWSGSKPSGERSRSSCSKGSRKGDEGAGLARLLEAEPVFLADVLVGEIGGRLAEPEREAEGMSAEARARFSGDEAGLRGEESRR